MAEPKDKNTYHWESQYARLGYFLVASSFLVATFIQLALVPDSTNNNITEKINILIHAVAALGSFIAALYTFMNFWAWMKRSTRDEFLHTWLVPLAFLVFWLVVWINVTDIFWWAILLITLGFLIGCFVFQILRPKLHL